MKTRTTRTFKKRAMSLLATFAMAAGTLAALPPMPAAAKDSVTLKDGVLTLNGAFTRNQLWNYFEDYDIRTIYAAPGCILPEDCSYLFEGGYEYYDQSCGDSGFYSYFGKAITIDLHNADASNVTDMSNMFYNGKNLTSIDLGSLDASNVTDMSNMFYNCNNLTELNLSSFDTSNVTDMSDMFFECKSLTTLDLSSFDTSNVTDMSGMFYNCNNLTELNLSSFDTSNVTDMSGMFNLCYSLTTLDLSSFDTSNVTYMSSMFYDCTSLTMLDLSSFDTSNVTYMSSMFYNCNNLTTIYAGNGWTVQNVDYYNFGNTTYYGGSNIFKNCTNLIGGNGTRYDSNHIDDEYAHIDGGAENPGYLTEMTTYPLTVGGVPVKELNCSDILGNGVFSYDPASNTLNVKGSYTCSDPVIESRNAGMTIQVTADSELTSTDNEALSLYKDNTIICKKRVSSGVRYKLTLSGKLEGIVQNNCPLTIQDARLEVHGSRFGIIGQTDRGFGQQSFRLNNNALSINNSSVSITSGSGAILGMKQGITQTNTAIYPVQRVLFSNQCFGITDRYGKILKNLTMVSKEDSVRIIRVSGDAAVILGEDAQFSVAAAGYDLIYQWQYKNPITKRWVNLDKSQATGIRTNTLTLAGIAENDGMQVRCLVGTTLFTDYSIPSSSMSLMVRTRFSERPKDFFGEIGSRSCP